MLAEGGAGSRQGERSRRDKALNLCPCPPASYRLLNFLVFLKHGWYPSLLERLTGMRLVYADALVSSLHLN